MSLPWKNGKLKNTAIVVRVDDRTAVKTSRGPRTAASRGGRPLSRRRRMFSKTTMELSTNMPKPRASAPRVSMLREIPKAAMRLKVMTTEKAIDARMRSDGPIRRRMRKIIRKTTMVIKPANR